MLLRRFTEADAGPLAAPYGDPRVSANACLIASTAPG